MDLAEARPRTVLITGALGGVLLGAAIAAITPTSMIQAPEPPWRAALPGRIAETVWAPTASAPEDPAPRFAEGYGYAGAGWSFPPELRTEWRGSRYEAYPVVADQASAPAELPGPAEAPVELERIARDAAQTAAAASQRAAALQATPAEPAPSEDELIPVDIEN